MLITGANRGIGLELARQYTAAGWRVIGTARKPEQAAELRALNARVLQLDVTDQQSIDRMAEELGDQTVDLLINNAGIFPRVRTITDVNFDDVTRTFAVNKNWYFLKLHTKLDLSEEKKSTRGGGP